MAESMLERGVVSGEKGRAFYAMGIARANAEDLKATQPSEF